jgi:hypothetical protein
MLAAGGEKVTRSEKLLLLTILLYIALFISADVINGATDGHVRSVFAILLGPFAFVFLNPKLSWAFPVSMSAIPWILAIVFDKKWLIYITLFIGAFFWLFLGIMGMGLQV